HLRTVPPRTDARPSLSNAVQFGRVAGRHWLTIRGMTPTLHRSLRSRSAAALLGLAAAAAALLAVVLPAAPAHAATPLPAPTQLQVVHISDTSADFWWTRDPSSSGDVVERKVNGVWREYARDLFGALALTNLTPGTTYTFRVYSIPYQYS